MIEPLHGIIAIVWVSHREDPKSPLTQSVSWVRFVISPHSVGRAGESLGMPPRPSWAAPPQGSVASLEILPPSFVDIHESLPPSLSRSGRFTDPHSLAPQYYLIIPRRGSIILNCQFWAENEQNSNFNHSLILHSLLRDCLCEALAWHDGSMLDFQIRKFCPPWVRFPLATSVLLPIQTSIAVASRIEIDRRAATPLNLKLNPDSRSIRRSATSKYW